MKRAFTYILLFSYVIVQIKPLTVIMEDTFAHAFFKMQHMATIHKENGRYHLHMELKDVIEKANQPASEKASGQQKFNESSPFHLTQNFRFQFATSYSCAEIAVRSNTRPVSVFIPINSPPPKG